MSLLRTPLHSFFEVGGTVQISHFSLLVWGISNEKDESSIKEVGV